MSQCSVPRTFDAFDRLIPRNGSTCVPAGEPASRFQRIHADKQYVRTPTPGVAIAVFVKVRPPDASTRSEPRKPVASRVQARRRTVVA